MYKEKSLKNYICEKKYEFTETDSQGRGIFLLMVRILILFLDMVPHKILKKLKLTEEKSVATVVEADFKTITKSNNQIR